MRLVENHLPKLNGRVGDLGKDGPVYSTGGANGEGVGGVNGRSQVKGGCPDEFGKERSDVDKGHSWIASKGKGVRRRVRGHVGHWNSEPGVAPDKVCVVSVSEFALRVRRCVRRSETLSSKEELEPVSSLSLDVQNVGDRLFADAVLVVGVVAEHVVQTRHHVGGALDELVGGRYGEKLLGELGLPLFQRLHADKSVARENGEQSVSEELGELEGSDIGNCRLQVGYERARAGRIDGIERRDKEVAWLGERHPCGY